MFSRSTQWRGRSLPRDVPLKQERTSVGRCQKVQLIRASIFTPESSPHSTTITVKRDDSWTRLRLRSIRCCPASVFSLTTTGKTSSAKPITNEPVSRSKTNMPTLLKTLNRVVATLLLATLPAALLPARVFASSHMDAPLITLDPAANTTDV